MFSNFFPSSFKMNHTCIGDSTQEHVYDTSEQAIMHIKACLMGDTESATAILGMGKKPLACKKQGRKVRPWNEELWQQSVEKIAVAVLLAKFSQNEALRAKLVNTGSSTLAEAAPHDRIWGIGLSIASAKTGQQWKGRNLLGNALMQVRNELA